MRIKVAVLCICVLASSTPALGVSSQDVDRITTYAVILGRAVACGADISDASRRVGQWMDVKFPPGSQDQQAYLPIFVNGVGYHAQQQKEGKSPDSCAAVLRNFKAFPWP